MKKIVIGTMLMFGFLFSYAQIDKEIGFKYVKAEYMLETERYEDAVAQLNDVIDQDPTYKNALILRGKTKYQLAAYKGAKLDAMKSIEISGITLEAAEVLAKSEYAMDNWDPAFNSLSTAIALGTEDYKIYEYRSEILMEGGKLLQGCEDLHIAADLGSTNAAIEARKICADRKPTKVEKKRNDGDVVSIDTPIDGGNEEENMEDPSVDGDGSGSSQDSTKVLSDTTETEEGNEDETEPVEEKDDNIPEEDDTKNTIVVDEELTLDIFGQGLGKRKILEKPSILILSDIDGVVAVEICVNESGKVETAEFVGGKSTIAKKSLVSLAIRKSKEFWFEKSKYPRTCGFIYFNVKAG